MKLTFCLHLRCLGCLKNAWKYAATPPYVLVTWCLTEHTSNSLPGAQIKNARSFKTTLWCLRDHVINLTRLCCLFVSFTRHFCGYSDEICGLKTCQSTVSWFRITIPSVRTLQLGATNCSEVGHRTGHEAQRWMSGSVLSLISALDGVCGQRHAPVHLPSGKRPDTHCTGVWVGPRNGLDGCGKSRPHRESIPLTVQPVASRYTD